MLPKPRAEGSLEARGFFLTEIFPRVIIPAVKVAVVLPTYNERENIGPLIPEIVQSFESLPHLLQIVVVDDKSPDGTAKVVNDLVKKIRKYENKIAKEKSNRYLDSDYSSCRYFHGRVSYRANLLLLVNIHFISGLKARIFII